MKRNNRCRWVLLLVLGCIVLAGCEKKEQEKRQYPYYIYYTNLEGTRLVQEGCDEQYQNVNEGINAMLLRLRTVQEGTEEVSALPDKVAIEKYVLEKEKLTIYFDNNYLTLNTVQEVLCRSALVRTLTQLDGVDLVQIYVGGEPFRNKKDEVIGFQTAEDFVQNTGASINSFETMELTLYFPNEEGNALRVETQNVRYNTGELKERIIIEHLIKKLEKSEASNNFTKDVKLLSVTVKDDVCYVNFNEGINNVVQGIKPEVILYSIVNSVVENGTVSRVQIAINGDSNIIYQESISLADPLSMNQDMVEGQ